MPKFTVIVVEKKLFEEAKAALLKTACGLRGPSFMSHADVQFAADLDPVDAIDTLAIMLVPVCLAMLAVKELPRSTVDIGEYRNRHAKRAPHALRTPA